jgi:Glycosyl transferase family 2
VVLPFHGSVPFLRQSLPGVLEQEGAEAVIHLIDDGTPGGAEEALRYWGSHPRVRTYRNVRNIGQFSSFNGVARYFETGLVAVQDADDVSYPHRLRRSGNLIRLADAEVFGGGMRPFLDPPGAEEEGGPTGPRSDDPWCSSLPYPGVRFFLLNPTAMMRVAAFEAMRGFGDYGDVECNKCGLDTEFYVRAYYAGVRFAISREVVVRYRVHAGSAVHNERTGWGSRSRHRSQTENDRRFADFQRGPFDPRVFGALRGAEGLTQRVEFR